ncbi:MAG: hypothetical protein NTX32_07530 [Candidatus Firestonebacteria bacterium]|nr:hypothetical protein [Candidatus Firestonebacteria bacterium]
MKRLKVFEENNSRTRGSETPDKAPQPLRTNVGLRSVTERPVSGSGYILLDALVGVGLLSLVIISALYLFSESINRMEDMKNETKAVFLAQSKIEELQALSSLEVNAGGDFGEKNQGYTWTASSEEIGRKDSYALIRLTLVVAWEARRNPRNYALETKFIQRR